MTHTNFRYEFPIRLVFHFTEGASRSVFIVFHRIHALIVWYAVTHAR